MKILVFTDNETLSEQMRSVILKKHPEYIVEKIRCSKDLEHLKNPDFDIVFLDDDLKENCIIAAMYIQKRLTESKVVLISDSLGTVSDMLLNIKLFGIIDKPVCFSKVWKYLNAANEKHCEKFVFKEKGRKRNLMFSNIIYIESRREKLLIKTASSTFSIWMKMGEAETQFPDYFVRCHNSFLVNMKYVIGYENNSFKLINGQEIIISRSKKEKTMEKFYAFQDSIR